MMKEFIKKAEEGQEVFIIDIRKKIDELDSKEQQTLSCILNLVDGSKRLFDLHVPILEEFVGKPGQMGFIKSYLKAEIYNILSVLGGVNMEVYVDYSNTELHEFANQLTTAFQINRTLDNRKFYGRCINVIDRMLSAIREEEAKFEFVIKDISEKPSSVEATPKPTGDTDIFKKVTQNLKGKAICGMDIGGSDIKVVMAVNGKICYLKEYDWFPEGLETADELIEPICLMVRLAKAFVSLSLYKEDKTSQDSDDEKLVYHMQLTEATHEKAPFHFINRVVTGVEGFLKRKGKLIEIDAIGISFPDVVVKDKVVGGEATKTRGMRNNKDIDYEKQFFKITELDKQLLELCKKGGVVKNINDGPIAAFTAAVEIAASNDADSVKDGVFAYTLGTELGAGWVDGAGRIPEIPLECYNLIIDLGNSRAKDFLVDDVRSTRNVNTGLRGTLQKYTSQSGVFRLAEKYFKQEGKRTDLYQEIIEKGYIEERKVGHQKLKKVVPTKPMDMRKAFLEHMMGLLEREEDDICKEIFRRVGEFLAITWIETQRIVAPGLATVILFGRLVKKPICFEMIKEGAARIQSGLKMEVADAASMANTSLMKQLESQHNLFTIAQFAQAVGAVYYGNMGLMAKE